MTKKQENRRYCGATKKDGGGQRCRQPAGYGTDHPGFGHCKFHAGSTWTGNAHAGRERAEIVAAEALEEVGVPARINAVQALQALLDRSSAHTNRLERAIGALSEDESASDFGRWLLDLWNAERDRQAKLSRAAIDVGLEDRERKLSDDGFHLVNATVEGILRDLDVDIHDPAVRAVVAQRMREAAQDPRAVRSVV